VVSGLKVKPPKTRSATEANWRNQIEDGRLRRWLRGSLGIGATWAVGWGGVGAVFGVGLAVAFPDYFTLVSSAISTGVAFAVLGFVGGATFASVLSLTEGRRRFDELSLPRFTGWGAVGGLLLGSIVAAGNLLRAGDPLVVDALVAAVATLLGAGCAATSLVIARMGEDRGLLRAGAELEGVGLTEDERRHLLGDTD
jgi:hypothetical protein